MNIFNTSILCCLFLIAQNSHAQRNLLMDAISGADFIKCQVGTSNGGQFFRTTGDFYLRPKMKSIPTPNVILVNTQTNTYARYLIEGNALIMKYFTKDREGKESPIGESTISDVFNIKKSQNEYGRSLHTQNVTIGQGLSIRTHCYSAQSDEILEKANHCADEDYGYRKKMLREMNISTGVAASAAATR